METNQENGEVVFYNEDGWLVTNQRICSSDATFRLSDIRQVDIQTKKNVWADIQFWIGICLLIVAGIVYFSNHLSDLGGFLCCCPGGISFLLSASNNYYTTRLVAHCTTGESVLGEFIWHNPQGTFYLIFLFSKHEAVQRARICKLDKLQSIKDAIGKALAHSTSTTNFPQQPTNFRVDPINVTAEPITPSIPDNDRVVVSCPNCGQKLRFCVQQNRVKVKCGACKHEFYYP